MILVELFTKQECSLCSDALIILERVQREIPFTLHEVTILPGDPWFEEYHELVPVVHINREFAFKYRVHEQTLRIRLEHLLSRPDVRGGDDR